MIVSNRFAFAGSLMACALYGFAWGLFFLG